MKKFYLSFTILLVANFSFSQTYIPFPTEVAQWNQVDTWYDGGPWGTYQTYNYQYRMDGDTTLDGIVYNKMYRLVNETSPQYIGGMREDDNRNIYFYPESSYLEHGIAFPGDTSEYLLYTFNNLEVGTILNINDHNNIEVIEIDSVLFNEIYHKRYTLSGTGMLGWEYWIEGIGSSDELFSSYTGEFENDFYTLCFKPDLITPYYISSPDEYDWCLYNVGTNDVEYNRLSVYPNPANDKITIVGELKENSQFLITNTIGSIVMKGNLDKSFHINTKELNPGLYSLMIFSGENFYNVKFLKL